LGASDIADAQRLFGFSGATTIVYESIGGGRDMKVLQIIPIEAGAHKQLFSSMVKKESEIRKKNRGTFYRVGRKIRNEAKWKYSTYSGLVNLKRGLSGVVNVEIVGSNQ
jgi:hypothetical protein